MRITRTRHYRRPWGRFVLVTPANPPRFGTIILNRYPGEVLGLVFCGPRSWRKLSWVWPITFHAKPEKKLIAEMEQHLRAEASTGGPTEQRFPNGYPEDPVLGPYEDATGGSSDG